MGGDEVDGDVVGGGVGEELGDPGGGGGCGATYAEARADCLEVAGGVVVELEVGGLAGDAAPEVDVGFIPDFEVPLGDFVDAVAVDEVLGEGGHEVVPALHALGGRDVLLVPEGVEVVGIEGELLGHEADLDDGANAVGEEAVVDLVDVGEVVDGVAVLVFVVDTDFVVEDAVEADVAEVGDFVDGADVVAVGLAEGEDGVAGAEDLLPEVGEGGGGGVGVDGDALRCLGVEGWSEGPRAEQSRKSESKPRVHHVQTPGFIGEIRADRVPGTIVLAVMRKRLCNA